MGPMGRVVQGGRDWECMLFLPMAQLNDVPLTHLILQLSVSIHIYQVAFLMKQSWALSQLVSLPALK
jgi:hypothetical protein